MADNLARRKVDRVVNTMVNRFVQRVVHFLTVVKSTNRIASSEFGTYLSRRYILLKFLIVRCHVALGDGRREPVATIRLLTTLAMVLGETLIVD